MTGANINKINSFKKQKQKEEMKHQVITFALMIIFTLVAFIAVGAGMNKTYVIPLILILALVQVGFQFYYFMHMKDKGHEVISSLIYGGIWIAAVTVLTFTTIIWW
ncbi:cytochrome c oxidase subunit IVB [Oceanobacillus caeni]|uniref:Cytochrome B6 n=1 Tax=Oceanobacillus caeni TaxID=405946 RepID=A0ABR5MI71_9BACI|nr:MULTISPECIES: cytochrome c oxidase subunit IVB [Bacillaceae]KKE78088.1 cytochrome B6 [Bacilli bacterium VT-13-104]PZD84071.1 cytochrome c oxidase subunit IVB [Bacilli bacterium]KPH73964.1 cytochrome B6 [Oceanobacillus caeni]MBU8791665.1 cytochrome c oxidase subunit IVB [Oceanobacillus caeni]MCR1835818.1 cytochrome c oxidase subunit IVB [Oceanobacillus caeni]